MVDPELAKVLPSLKPLTQPQLAAQPSDASDISQALMEERVYQLARYYERRLPSESEYTVTDVVIPVEAGTINVRVLTPTGKGGGATYPVFVWFHGGGWMVGDIAVDDNHLRTISVDLQLVVVNVEYRHAPEHPFPTAFNDCYAGLKWTVENATGLHISLNKGFIVGGDSAGGNLSAAVALKARDDPFFSGRSLSGQYLREPTVIHPSAHSDSKYASELNSYAENENSPLVNSDNAASSFRIYAAPLTDVRVSPLLAPSHAGLPPAFFQVMEIDPFRDEGIVYEKVLREAGVPTRIVQHPGAMHGFYYSFPQIPLAGAVDQHEREGLKWLLSLTHVHESEA